MLNIQVTGPENKKVELLDSLSPTLHSFQTCGQALEEAAPPQLCLPGIAGTAVYHAGAAIRLAAGGPPKRLPLLAIP